MQSLDLFLSRLIPKVPGCPDPTARRALVDSAIEFCEETAIIQSTSDPQPMTAGVGVYSVDTVVQQRVVATLKVWHGTNQLQPAPADQVDAILAYVSAVGAATAVQGTPTVFYEFSPGQIGIYPVPDATAAALPFSARICTKPDRTATSVEDVLYHDWIEAIVAGAAARLQDTPGHAFSSPGTAQTERSKFWLDVSKATNIALRGRIRTSVSVRGRSFI